MTKLSDAQQLMLFRASKGKVEYNWATLPEYQTAKSLSRKGFLAVQYGSIGRFFKIRLTKAGKEYLNDQ